MFPFHEITLIILDKHCHTVAGSTDCDSYVLFYFCLLLNHNKIQKQTMFVKQLCPPPSPTHEIRNDIMNLTFDQLS